MADQFEEQDISHITPRSLAYDSIINYIRLAVYGKNVREAIAQGIEHCHEKYEQSSEVVAGAAKVNVTISKDNSTGVVTITVTNREGKSTSKTVTDGALLIKDNETATSKLWSSSKISSAIHDAALYEKIEISSVTATPATAEVGSTVSSVSLAYSLNKAAKTIKVNNKAVSNTAASGTITQTGTWNGTAPQTKVDFTLKVIDELDITAPTKTASLIFQNRIYYGPAAAPSEISSSFITGLTKIFDGNTRKHTVSVTAGSGKYIYYAVPSRLGACTFTVGGFTGGFTRVAIISVTNESEYSEQYYIYKSDNANLGSTSVVVT